MSRLIRVEGGVAYVPLTKGYEAIIDAADVPLVAGRCWTAQERRRRDGTVKVVYAVRREKNREIRMHTLLLQPAPGFLVDHEDCNGLNNRRSNLREATHQQNNQNTRASYTSRTGVKGVGMHKGRIRARIREAGRQVHLGYFETLDAAQAALVAARARIHGSFARHA
jgi:hypothetical protein